MTREPAPLAAVDLAGCSVWLTRPRARAAEWQHALSAAGAAVIVEPLLTIAGPDHVEAAAAGLDRAARADCVIAASASAVAALACLRPAWRPRGRLIGLGSATADALARHTGKTVKTPAIANSEGVLAMPELAAMVGRTVAILAGHGGRAALADGLAARGARVDKLALYRRRPAEIGRSRLDEVLAVSNVLIVTSIEAWQNLSGRLGPDQRMRLGQLGLVAASHRLIRDAAAEIDWSVEPALIEPMNAAGALRALDRVWPALRS